MSRFAVIQKVATSSERKKQRSASSQRRVFQLACFQMRLPCAGSREMNSPGYKTTPLERGFNHLYFSEKAEKLGFEHSNSSK
jgi:hypothetical protein